MLQAHIKYASSFHVHASAFCKVPENAFRALAYEPGARKLCKGLGPFDLLQAPLGRVLEYEAQLAAILNCTPSEHPAKKALAKAAKGAIKAADIVQLELDAGITAMVEASVAGVSLPSQPTGGTTRTRWFVREGDFELDPSCAAMLGLGTGSEIVLRFILLSDCLVLARPREPSLKELEQEAKAEAGGEAKAGGKVGTGLSHAATGRSSSSGSRPNLRLDAVLVMPLGDHTEFHSNELANALTVVDESK